MYPSIILHFSSCHVDFYCLSYDLHSITITIAVLMDIQSNPILSNPIQSNPCNLTINHTRTRTHSSRTPPTAMVPYKSQIILTPSISHHILLRTGRRTKFSFRQS
eukprot:226262_1